MTPTPCQPVPHLLTRAALRLAATRWGGVVFTTLTPPLDRALLRATTGRFSIAGLGAPTLLLTTRGRRSGRLLATPLLYLRAGTTLAVIASRGGRPRAPHWYQNLRAHPRALVTLDGVQAWYAARETSGPERRTWWLAFTRFNPGFERYQSRVAHDIPILLLEPADV